MTQEKISSRAGFDSTLKLLKYTGLAGLGTGIAARLAQLAAKKKKRVSSPTLYSSMPLIESAGPSKEAGVLSAVVSRAKKIAEPGYRVYDKAMRHSKQPGLPAVLATATGALGLGGGYGLTNRVIHEVDRPAVDDELAQREELFNKLLLEEQAQSAGVKEADVIDAAIGTILEKVWNEKKAAAAHLDPKTLRFLGTILGLTALGSGYSYGRASHDINDANTKAKKTLVESLGQRLAGNPEGPKAPMVVKVKTDRLGTTPMSAKNVISSRGIDVLDRL